MMQQITQKKAIQDTHISQFKEKVCKLKEHRHHDVVNSNGVKKAFQWVRKNKWLDIGRGVSEHDFYLIVGNVNKLLRDNLSRGETAHLPCRMGLLELRKFDTLSKTKNGGLCISLGVDWDKTLRLWAEDPNSFKNKMLIRKEWTEAFTIFYNRSDAIYNNKSFYEFRVSRALKRMLKDKFKYRQIDAYKL